MDNIKLAAQLKIDEAIKRFPYKDTVGKTTIGVGRNLTDVGISSSEVDYLLNNDIDVVIASLNKNLPWWSTLSENRQLVLANMCFNLGINRLINFSITLNYVKTGQYDKAADAMMQSIWAKQVGARATRLYKLMKEG